MLQLKDVSAAPSPFCVLIVDDQAPIRALLRAALTPTGASCVEAERPAGALDTLQEKRPDLVFLDVYMDGSSSGLEFCRYLKTLADAPYICLMSSLGRQKDISAGKQAGADSYLVKPFPLPELDRVIQVSLAR